MSTKSKTKKSPRAMPVETIITRYKSAQRQQQLDKGRRGVTKSKASRGNVDSTKRPKQKLPTKQLRDVAKTNPLKAVDSNVAEFYPDKPKRSVPNKKILLLPKHCLKVIGGTKGCDKRKLHVPQKDVKRPKCDPNSPLASDGSKLPKDKIESVELTIKDMVLLIEEKGGLDDEDLLEILTCPSPVWWEDPPSGYIEDPIFARSKPEEQKSVKKQLLEEQNNEAERKRFKARTDSSCTNISNDVHTDKLDVSKIDITVVNRGVNFMSKRCKLESLLGSIKDKARNKDTDKKHKDNAHKKLSKHMKSKNSDNNYTNLDDNTNTTQLKDDDIHDVDTDVSKTDGDKRNSDSFDDDNLLYLDDDEILSLENIIIPIAPNNAIGDKSETSSDKDDARIKGDCVNATSDVSDKVKSNLSTDRFDEQEGSRKIIETKASKNKVHKHTVHKEQIKACSTGRLKISNNCLQIDTPSNKAKHTIPYIRVKKIETMKPFHKTNEPIKNDSLPAEKKKKLPNVRLSDFVSIEHNGYMSKVTNENDIKDRLSKIVGNASNPANEIDAFAKIDENLADVGIIELDADNDKVDLVEEMEVIEIDDEILSDSVSEIDASSNKFDDEDDNQFIDDSLSSNSSCVQIESINNVTCQSVVTRRHSEVSENGDRNINARKDSEELNTSKATSGTQAVSARRDSLKPTNSDDPNVNVASTHPFESQVVNARRDSIESEGSDKNMSVEYLDMSLFDEEDNKIESQIDNNEQPVNEYDCDTPEVDSQSVESADQMYGSDLNFVSKLSIHNKIDESTNSDINKCNEDKIENDEVSTENHTEDADNKDGTEYVAVYKIITSDSENESSLVKHNEIKDSAYNAEVNLNSSVVAQTTDSVNRHINNYYKQCKRNGKNKSDKSSKGKVFGDSLVKSDCKSCYIRKKTIVISDNDTVKYCLVCSSIFDTEYCKFCIPKSNSRCTCKVDGVGEYQCDVCKMRVDSKQDLIEHFSKGKCGVSIS